MKILMVSIDFPPKVGGISAHVYELSKALIRAGHKVYVFTRKKEKDEKDSFIIEGIQVFKFRLKFVGLTYGIQINNFVKRHIKQINPDIIHIHGLRPLEWYNIKEIPLVYTNHTSGYLKRIKKGGFRRLFLLKRLFKKIDLFLAPSMELLEVPFKIKALKKMITNGVDSSKYEFSIKDRTRLRKELNIEDSDKLGILTRRLVEKNGVIFLAKATAFIKDKNVKFLIIGDGEERENIEKELNKNFKNRFIMLGSKSHNDIIPYYSAADFSVLPSLLEATSISGLEAMSSSLPMVGTRTGGIPDIIQDGYNGYLCEKANEQDLAQKIDNLLAKDYKKMGDNSKKLVKERFDWSKIANETVKAYKDGTTR